MDMIKVWLEDIENWATIFENATLSLEIKDTFSGAYEFLTGKEGFIKAAEGLSSGMKDFSSNMK